jgi:hypothetical protein
LQLLSRADDDDLRRLEAFRILNPHDHKVSDTTFTKLGKSFARKLETSEAELGIKFAVNLFTCIGAVYSSGAKDSCIQLLTDTARFLSVKFRDKPSPSTYRVRAQMLYVNELLEQVSHLITMIEKSKIAPPPIVQTSLAQVVCIMTLVSEYFNNMGYSEVMHVEVEGEKKEYKYRIQIGRPKKTLLDSAIVPYADEGIELNEDLLDEIADLKEMLSQSFQILELEMETVQIAAIQQGRGDSEETLKAFTSDSWENVDSSSNGIALSENDV